EARTLGRTETVRAPAAPVLADHPGEATPDDLAAAGASGPVREPGYVAPTDPRAVAALEHWHDLKFGPIVHWGLYTHLGQAGPWSLCRENSGAFMEMNEDLTGTEAEWNTYYDQASNTRHGQDNETDEW